MMALLRSGKTWHTARRQLRGPTLCVYFGSACDWCQLGFYIDRSYGGSNETNGTSIDDMVGVKLLLPWLTAYVMFDWRVRTSYRFILSGGYPSQWPSFWDEHQESAT